MLTYTSNTHEHLKVIADDLNFAVESFDTKGYFNIRIGVVAAYVDGVQVREPHVVVPEEAFKNRAHNVLLDTTTSFIFRSIAQRAKRPFVRAYVTWNRDVNGIVFPDRVTLVVPKRKYLSPIIAPLCLAPNIGTYYNASVERPLSWWNNTQNFYFYFYGMDIWNGFEARMTTDPDMRRAMRLPPATCPSNKEST